MEQTVHFNVIKEKIIKTSELLQLYEEKSTKLSRASRAYKELKARFETNQQEVTRLKLDNERLTFSLNNSKGRQDELETLREQFSNLEDKYSQTVIESQLRYQSLEEQLEEYQSKKVIKAELINSRKSEEKVKELEEKLSELKKIEAELRKENASLVLQNKSSLKDLVHEKKIGLQIKTQLTEENKLLCSQIKNLNQKLKNYQTSSLNLSSLQHKLAKLENEKNLEISDLRKKVLNLTLHSEDFTKIETENKLLKTQIVQLKNEISEKNSKISIERKSCTVQTEAPNDSLNNGCDINMMVSNTYINNEGFSSNLLFSDKNKAVKGDLIERSCKDDILNEEIMLSVEDILKGMILPRALSPVSISSSNVDDHYIDLLDDLENSLPPQPTHATDHDSKSLSNCVSQNIPDIIITPPTPNIEKSTLDNNFPQFIKKTTTEPVNPICNETERKEKIQVTFHDVSVQTEIVRKKFRATPFLRSSDFVKLRRSKVKNEIFARPLFKKPTSIVTKKHSSDSILEALQVLKENKINFTISSDSVPPIPTYDYYNIPTTYPQLISTLETNTSIPKYQNTMTKHLTKCWCKECMEHNSLMLVDNTRSENLLGFFSLKSEVITPAVSRLGSRVTESSDKLDTKNLLNQLLDGIKELVATKNSSLSKSPTRKRKKKLANNSEFNSETETELERLFKNSNVLQRNKMLLKVAQNQKEINSECDTLLESDTNQKLDISESSVPNTSRSSYSTNECSSSFGVNMKKEDTIPSIFSKLTTCPELLSPLASSTAGCSPPKRYSERLRDRKASSDTLTTCGNNRATRASRKIKLEVDENVNSNSIAERCQEDRSVADTRAFSNETSKATLLGKDKASSPKSKRVCKDRFADTDCGNREKEVDRCNLAEQLHLSDSDTGIDTNRNSVAPKKKTGKKPAQKTKKKPISKLKSKVLQQTKTIRHIFSKKNANVLEPLVVSSKKYYQSDNESAKESVRSADSGFYDATLEISVNSDNVDNFSPKVKDVEKVRVVQNILIGKPGGPVIDLMSNKANNNFEIGCNDRKRIFDNCVAKTEETVPVSKTKRRRIEERIKPNTDADILGKVIQDMIKSRPLPKMEAKKKVPLPLDKTTLNYGMRSTVPDGKINVNNLNLKGRIENVNGTNSRNPVSNPVNSIENTPNCSKNVEDDGVIPECPQSPEPEEVVESVPKIIPTEPPQRLPPSKVEMFFNKLYNFPKEDEVLENIVKQFAGQDVEYLVQIILDQLSFDITEKATNKYHLSPVLTDTQRILMGLMSRLKRETHPNIYDKFLSFAEIKLFNTSTCKLEIVEPITRLYTAICKLRRDINRMRKFVCEAFYFMGDFAVPLFFFVLTIWAEVLPMEAECKAFPMAKVLVQIVQLKDCVKPGYNLFPLRDLLHKYFGYPKERWICDTVFEDILIEYLRNPALRSSDFMLLLFCKNKPTNWVYQKLKSKVMPLLDRIPSENHNLKATIIILIGNICHSFSKFEEYDGTVIREITAWLRQLDTDTTPNIVKRSIYLAVKRLPKPKTKKSSEGKTENTQEVGEKSIEAPMLLPKIEENVLEIKTEEH